MPSVDVATGPAEAGGADQPVHPAVEAEAVAQISLASRQRGDVRGARLEAMRIDIGPR